jgi:transcriptional regulator with XRE-family HTH domain
MDIIKNILAIRKEKGITQEVIADALFVDVSVISNIEKGKRELRVGELEKIANSLGVDVVYLITYPYIYEKKIEGEEKIPKMILQIELENEVKADVVKLAFGDRVLEIRNK